MRSSFIDLASSGSEDLLGKTLLGDPRAHDRQRRKLTNFARTIGAMKPITKAKGLTTSADSSPAAQSTPARGGYTTRAAVSSLSGKELKSICLRISETASQELASVHAVNNLLASLGQSVSEELVEGLLAKLDPPFRFQEGALLSRQQFLELCGLLKEKEIEERKLAKARAMQPKKLQDFDVVEFFTLLGGSSDKTGTVNLESIRALLVSLCEADIESSAAAVDRRESSATDRRDSPNHRMSIASMPHTKRLSLSTSPLGRSGRPSLDCSIFTPDAKKTKVSSVHSFDSDSVPGKYLVAFDQFFVEAQVQQQPIPELQRKVYAEHWVPGRPKSVVIKKQPDSPNLSAKPSFVGSPAGSPRSHINADEASSFEISDQELSFQDLVHLMDVLRGAISGAKHGRNPFVVTKHGDKLGVGFTNTAQMRSPRGPASQFLHVASQRALTESTRRATTEEPAVELIGDDDPLFTDAGSVMQASGSGLRMFQKVAKQVTQHLRTKSDAWKALTAKPKMDRIADNHVQRMKKIRASHNQIVPLLDRNLKPNQLVPPSRLKVLLPSGESDEEMHRVVHKFDMRTTVGRAPRSVIRQQQQLEEALSDPSIVRAVEDRIERARAEVRRPGTSMSAISKPSQDRSRSATLNLSRERAAVMGRPMTPNDLVEAIAQVARQQPEHRRRLEATARARDTDCWSPPVAPMTQKEYDRNQRLAKNSIDDVIAAVSAHASSPTSQSAGSPAKSRRNGPTECFVFCDKGKPFRCLIDFSNVRSIPALLALLSEEADTHKVLQPHLMVDDVHFNPRDLDVDPTFFAPVPDIDALVNLAAAQANSLRLKIITKRVNRRR